MKQYFRRPQDVVEDRDLLTYREITMSATSSGCWRADCRCPFWELKMLQEQIEHEG